jgi:hypothetical protein
VQPDLPLPHALARLAIPGDHDSGFPRADDELPAVVLDEHR